MKETGMPLAKRKKMETSCENDDDDDDRSVPYKVSYPGQYDPYESRPLKDPRLGNAQKSKERFCKKLGITDFDDWGSSEDESEDETTSEDGDESTKVLPTRIIKLPITYHHPPVVTSRNGKHISRIPLNSIENEAKNLKERDCECAETAIKFYNEQHGTDYEIVETLGSYTRCYIGFWFHCNFRAQCKSDPSSPPKLFFAELHRKRLPNLVKVCVPLDDPENSSHIVRGCEMCGNQLLHPVNGFEAGKIGRFMPRRSP